MVLDILKANNEIKVLGFLDDDEKKQGSFLDGVRVIGKIGDIEELRHIYQIEGVVVAIGDNYTRADIFKRFKLMEFKLINAIHPQAVISPSVRIGEGFVAMAGVVINPGTIIGDDVCVNTGAIIDHDCVLEDHCHIFPGAKLTGGVKIGKFSTIGTNATINPYLNIGSNSIVGSGAVVIRDVGDNVVVVGVPARPIRENNRVSPEGLSYG